MLVDLLNDVVSGCSLFPFAVSTSGDAGGVAVDLANGTAWCAADLNVGAFSGSATPTLNAVVQCNSVSTATDTHWATVATFAAVTTSNQRQVVDFSVPAGSRYARITGTTGGTVTSAVASGSIYSQKRYAANTQGGFDRSPST